MFYSRSSGGFYDQALHGTAIPSDAIEIDRATYDALFAAQANGQVIQTDANGHPVAVTPTLSSPTIEQQIAALERTQSPRRYREAINGTDGGWLKNIDAQITALRVQLPKTS